MSERVLVVEPEYHVRETICVHFRLAGYACDQLTRGRSQPSSTYGLIVAELGQAHRHAPEWYRRICDRAGRRIPLLVTATTAQESAAIDALDTVADAYLLKPLSLVELLARARALIRRAALAPAKPRPVAYGDISVEPERRRAIVGGRPIKLTEQEFQLLLAFVSDAGCVFDRRALLSRVWGDRVFVSARSVDTLVKRVRHRLRDSGGDPGLIRTIHGVGYSFGHDAGGAATTGTAAAISSAPSDPWRRAMRSVRGSEARLHHLHAEAIPAHTRLGGAVRT